MIIQECHDIIREHQRLGTQLCSQCVRIKEIIRLSQPIAGLTLKSLHLFPASTDLRLSSLHLLPPPDPPESLDTLGHANSPISKLDLVTTK